MLIGDIVPDEEDRRVGCEVLAHPRERVTLVPRHVSCVGIDRAMDQTARVHG